MRYARARDILPAELLDQLQQYVDGAYLYVPRREENKLGWGERTHSKAETARRNAAILRESENGRTTAELAQSYFLTEKTIRRILLEERRMEKDREGRE